MVVVIIIIIEIIIIVIIVIIVICNNKELIIKCTAQCTQTNNFNRQPESNSTNTIAILHQQMLLVIFQQQM